MRAIDAIRNAKPFAKGAVDEYLESCVTGLNAFRLAGGGNDFDEQVVKSIEEFLPHRAQLIELFVALVQYRASDDTAQQLHRFFERLLPYLDAPEGTNQWSEGDFDNFRFIVHELFLYCVAVQLKYEAFGTAAYMMREPYYIPKGRRGGNSTVTTFSSFRQYLSSLRHRNKRLEARRLSLHADFLEQRSHASGIDIRHVLQADFVLFLRGALDQLRGAGEQWWPETLLYAQDHGAFEFFARALSKQYFSRLFPLFGITSKDDLGTLLKAFQEQKIRTPTWEFRSVNPAAAMGYEKLATAP